MKTNNKISVFNKLQQHQPHHPHKRKTIIPFKIDVIESQKQTIQQSSLEKRILNCQLVEDGKESIRIEDLVKSYSKNLQKPKLIPLSLVINENTTEYITAPEDVAYNCVTIKVDVPTTSNDFIPTTITMKLNGEIETYRFLKYENPLDPITMKYGYYILITPNDENTCAVEFKIIKEKQSPDFLKEGYYCGIVSSEELKPNNVNIYGISNDEETLMISLEGNPFTQELKFNLNKTI